ncbi:uncharacterized protein EV420DRAFT_421332 [Desarmillaria tabescens]|uniref:Secreted protein n=1 Tax=Armillaria tabescens TaxID=1929756 RepID=A0AA39J2B2_ARMTA|nr:uncharacterized protein EV420DRAFT_421332 [Desarmillaria tabescens]KAK0434175.1 hypothetical protein EV420DRAFT_421332 [Desarmillaria tabescens]
MCLPVLLGLMSKGLSYFLWSLCRPFHPENCSAPLSELKGIFRYLGHHIFCWFRVRTRPVFYSSIGVYITRSRCTCAPFHTYSSSLSMN